MSIELHGKRVDLPQLQDELITAGIQVPTALGTSHDTVFTFDADGAILDLPPAAQPVVDAHVPPPALLEFAAEQSVHAITRTTDAAPLEVFRFPCEQLRLYRASLTISGVDAGNFVSKVMEARFTWKRTTGNAIVVGLTVVSDIHDTAAASWAPNFAPVGSDIVFTVQGAAGRTIDWLLVGPVGSYAPAGLE